MADWNSEMYLKFKAQRTQPAVDLARRVGDLVAEPREIIDLGCGPGNSTRVLKERFPKARIIGADNSENMLEKARGENPDLEFTKLDISGGLSGCGEYDVVFSNACLQWVNGHRELFPRIFSMVKPGGVFAAQIPMNYDEPIHKIIARVTESAEWKPKLGQGRIFGTLTISEYYDLLSGLTDDFEVWQTVYCHRMPSIASIIEWYSSTGLRTYLAALSDVDKPRFIDEITAELEREYPKQANGEIIFRFPRFFFAARKENNVQGVS